MRQVETQKVTIVFEAEHLAEVGSLLGKMLFVADVEGVKWVWGQAENLGEMGSFTFVPGESLER